MRHLRTIVVLALLLGTSACGDSSAAERDAVTERNALAGSSATGEPRLGDAFALPDGDRPGGASAVVEPHPRAGAWSSRLVGFVERFTADAVRLSKGKVRASDVRVSIHVRNLDEGYDLGIFDADSARAPASNMKLVTTAAALVLLGPRNEFRTPIEALGRIENGTLHGDLVARASGDPLVRVDGDGRVEERLDVVARALVERGIRRVTGDIVLDEGTFATPAPAPGWPSSNQYWQEHCALSGGFTINGSVLQATVDPGRAGTNASVAVHPAPHGLRSKYGVVTGGSSLDIRVGASASTVTVTGKIPAGRPPYTAEFAHPDPVAFFGAVLEARLEAGGVTVDGGVRVERGVPAGEVVAELRSSVDDTLIPINADSRNSVADQLFLAVGNAIEGEGNRIAGAEASRRALAILGVDAAGFEQADGSGLSRDNRVSPRQLTALIAGVLTRDADTARTFRQSLAVSGRRGTLEDRMTSTAAEGRVFAKTGWITGVSALSGVCTTATGSELAFSILVEYPPSAGGLNTNVFKPMQDAILVALVEDAP